MRECICSFGWHYGAQESWQLKICELHVRAGQIVSRQGRGISHFFLIWANIFNVCLLSLPCQITRLVFISIIIGKCYHTSKRDTMPFQRISHRCGNPMWNVFKSTLNSGRCWTNTLKALTKCLMPLITRAHPWQTRPIWLAFGSTRRFTFSCEPCFKSLLRFGRFGANHGVYVEEIYRHPLLIYFDKITQTLPPHRLHNYRNT